MGTKRAPPCADARFAVAGVGTWQRETAHGKAAWTRRYLDRVEAARRRFDAQDKEPLNN
ncbi:hypothetical protein [Streptomyces sp. NRRL S-1813]|uniref:hypothetical protein n=1 Tax=Streptomyces sp. NRRL S-1813 TaxID=1463888 RepID=UPI00131B7ADD|nr:hypothetical protein [Streptomyces sp. NRRL S-1813]